MKVLITGAAGFIGSAVAIRLLERGDEVIGFDNHNDYYDPQLKEARLKRQLEYIKYTHVRGDVADRVVVGELFRTYKPNYVIHLAAQAGIRYSLENPDAYIDSNLVGFGNILEGCRQHNIEHLVFASSSSVYGSNTKMPFSVHDNVSHPVSLYAATKRANELMAHSYSHLFNIPTTGLRFFTVYGPWDRPDMALQKFAKAIVNDESIKLFNFGNHKRDFTYIDDVVEGVIRVLDKPAKSNQHWDSDNPDPATSYAPWCIYNIGNNNPVELKDYVAALEDALGKQVEKEYLPLQAGDVEETFADVDDLVRDFDYKPVTSLEEGMKKYAEWYNSYYK